MDNLIFITGTDTGVGKTVLTALLLQHLRQAGCHAWAMKPFCSGGREDIELLDQLQNHEMPPDWLNPYYFEKPLAPAPAAKLEGRAILIEELFSHIEQAKTGCELLLIEGAGGIFVPLVKRFMIFDLIKALNAPTVVVAPNRLGCINHSLLTLNALEPIVPSRTLVLMGCKDPDLSAESNPVMLKALLPFVTVQQIPFLDDPRIDSQVIRKQEKNVRKQLATILGSTKLFSVFGKPGRNSGGKFKNKRVDVG